jgi:hypothetical protein
MSRTPLIRPALGFLVWAGGFVALYAGLSVGCAFGWPAAPLRAGLVALAAVVVAAGAALALRLGRAQARPLGRIAFLSALAALASSLFTFLPVAALSLCR